MTDVEAIGTAEAAEIIGVTPRHVRRLIETQEIPVIRKANGRGRSWVLDAEVVRDFAEHHHTT